MSQQQSFNINLVSNASMSTFPDNTLAKFTTLLPQSLVLHGTWEVALVELSWPGLIENVTEGLFSYQLNRDEQNRDTSTQETIVDRPRFGNGMVSMYVPRNLLKRNSSTLEEFSPEKYFSITKGCYSSVNSILQSMCDNICSSVGWNISQLPLSWDICGASQLLHLKFNTTSNKENKKIRLKALSEDLKNILGLEYLVDCSQTNNDSKQPEENHDLEVPQDCKKPKKVERRREMSEQIGNYPVDLTAGCHTMFVYCNLVQNEILGDTQTALRAVPLGDNKRQRTFTRIQWRGVIKSSIHSLTIALRNEAGGLIPFLSRGRTNLTLQFRQRK